MAFNQANKKKYFKINDDRDRRLATRPIIFTGNDKMPK